MTLNVCCLRVSPSYRISKTQATPAMVHMADGSCSRNTRHITTHNNNTVIHRHHSRRQPPTYLAPQLHREHVSVGAVLRAVHRHVMQHGGALLCSQHTFAQHDGQRAKHFLGAARLQRHAGEAAPGSFQVQAGDVRAFTRRSRDVIRVFFDEVGRHSQRVQFHAILLRRGLQHGGEERLRLEQSSQPCDDRHVIRRL